jgi:hypothetical protein
LRAVAVALHMAAVVAGLTVSVATCFSAVARDQYRCG